MKKLIFLAPLIGLSLTCAAQSVDDNNVNDKNHGITLSMSTEYGFLPKEDGVKGTNNAYAITFGANYYFMHPDRGVFAGARIGYNSASFHNHAYLGPAEYVTANTDTHFITLPINVGYAFTPADSRFGVSPLAGIDVNFCVAGKHKIKDGSNEIKRNIKKKVAFDARFGLQFRIYGFNVGASYVLPIGDNQKAYFGKDGYFAVNIGFGF